MNTTTTNDRLTRIAAAIDECTTDLHRALDLPHGSDWDNVARAARLALISARLSAWWGVMAREVFHSTLPHHLLLGKAVIGARHAERNQAKFWRESAAEWRARAERRPTSDAAGALSNWHELGVSA